jgi:hypothetical protein
MIFSAKAIDPIAIRYSTCGDWEFLPNGTLHASVPDYGAKHDNAFLVALHEIVEGWLCKKDGILEHEVLGFDKSHPELEEPGDSPDAPYHKQHMVATAVEKLVCEAMGLSWEGHDKWVQNSAEEVDRNLNEEAPWLTLGGSRFWAELHLYALRHNGKNASGWFNEWRQSIPFEGCPCEEHLVEYLADNPPDWHNFFEWTIDLHNAVNSRIGKPLLDVENARLYWANRPF